ncbi:MAG: PD-(D/E)XK nuclease family protein [Bacteroidota bacterium]
MKNESLISINKVLSNTSKIIRRQEELKKLKGESFNIFSILQIEHSENRTHSAFLAELLNPKGSHLCGAVFLKHFFKVLNYDEAFDTKSANVELEKHIGSVDNESQTGGRIDIWISDLEGNSVSIENKIYAGDQEMQILRYYNFRPDRNKVYYLTLDGQDPSKSSSGNLKSGENFFCISYEKTILEWLNLCLKEAVELPILRESIKQYIILIKKLTGQLADNQMESELFESIKKNSQAARLIASEWWKAEVKITRIFLDEVISILKNSLGEDYTIYQDDDLNKAYTGLYIKNKSWNGLYIKLDGDPKIPWSHTYYGIVGNKREYDYDQIKKEFANVDLLSGFKSSDAWPFWSRILRFHETEVRDKLFDDSSRRLIVENTAEKLLELVKVSNDRLKRIKKISTHD